MKKYVGYIALVSVMVITALFAGCITQMNQSVENSPFNQTIQTQLSPPIHQLGKESLKSESADFANNTATSSTLCINHTRNNPECKDCCDCLDGDALTRKSCRDGCATHDFGLNTNFITIRSVSVSGPKGDYSVCFSNGSVQACKECCDGSPALSCGDRRFCRDVCNAMVNES